ncbi:alpha/beta hydrolase [Actinomadura fibrosa]|uniref:Alpha/beta hydrolase n=1 Tax=Actinomadura fibrosa TaxID=111802 RepID=A0ABW2Y2J4_9ACTN|nr:alpha/beta hydrolase [Actinomadura fibrosa]
MWKSIAAILITLAAAAAPAPPAHAAPGTCETVKIPVALAPGQPSNQTVSGTLCVPSNDTTRVDVLVHGGTYNSTYWKWPDDRYSYVKKTTDAGRAAFAYDRPGTGSSSRPPSTSLTVAADVNVLHQIVQWLRARNLTQITTIGHSLGSMIVIAEAADHGDIDRLVVTGITHPPAIAPGAALLIGSFYTAALDPHFPLADLGYLTTEPGTRAASFYYAADPDVIAYDEAHKDVMAATELTDAAARLVLPPLLNDTARVRVPVLVVIGEKDSSICGALFTCTPGNVRANESLYYTAAPTLTADTIPNTGHSLPLHPTADRSFNDINAWINTH